jgi:hypothetical protein
MRFNISSREDRRTYLLWVELERGRGDQQVKELQTYSPTSSSSTVNTGEISTPILGNYIFI